MKKTSLALSLIAAMAVTGFAQGKIDFRNGSSQLPSPPDRLVRTYDGVELVGDNYVIQLFLEGAANDATAAVVEAPKAFRAAGTSVPGTWRGGSVTFESADSGAQLSLIARAWDSALGTYADAVAAVDADPTLGNAWGQSAAFAYTVPNPTDPPSAFFMANFEGFALNTPVPEPSMLALLGLGMAGLLIRFRRK